MTKPITTVEVISTILGMVKTGLVALTLIAIEYEKMEKAKARLSESLAKNDLEIEKAKNEKNLNNKPDSIYVDEFIASQMLHGSGDLNPGVNDKRP